MAGPDPEERTDGPLVPVLTGFRIGVTSDRRSGDLIDAFVRRGAEVIHAPAVRIAPVEEDDVLIADTRAIIERAQVVIVTTAYGLRRWVERAEAAGLGDALHETLEAARIIVRGPKAAAPCGRQVSRTTRSPRTSGRPRRCRSPSSGGVGRAVVAMQLHGHEDVEQLDRLRAAGATVHTVAPYRWVRPTDESRLGRLCGRGRRARARRRDVHIGAGG